MFLAPQAAACRQPDGAPLLTKDMDTMHISRILSTLSLLLALSLLAGCSHIGKDETHGWSAEQFYNRANDQMNRGNYSEAIEMYTKLEARYPYGRFAQQAQIEVIYAHYKASEPASAVAAADRFIRLYPRHPNVDYAYYMRGLATFEQGAGFLERWLPQDRAKRDPAGMRESFNYFRELVSQFPDSRYSSDAVARMTILRNNLARHEVLVADYYLRRGVHLAAANRGKYVLEHYPQSTAIPDALAVMLQAYREMGMDDLAEDAKRVLTLNYPEHPVLKQ